MRILFKHRLRNIEASIRLKMMSTLQRSQVQAALDGLSPYDVGIPLVRIGGANDGGYLLPDDLDGIEALYSPGVSTEIGFDCAVMERGIPSYMIDASVNGIEGDHPLATFEKLFLGPETGGEFISLNDWVAQKTPEATDLMMQMDIEGAEYDAIAAASDDCLRRFRVMVIEFHAVHRILQPGHFTRYKAALDKLARHFTVVHLHPNNASAPVTAGDFAIPAVFEATFLRRDRFTSSTVKPGVHHPLDRPNVNDRPVYDMPRFWS